MRRELRKLYETEWRIAQDALALLLVWSVKHALERDRMIGRKITELTLERSTSATIRMIGDIADAGALRYFDVRDRGDLLGMPLEVRHMGDGVVSIATVRDTCGWIMRGGARRRGWVAPSEITLDDLRR